MNFFTLHGGKLVTLEKFNPKTYSAMLGENSDSTMLFTAPPLGTYLLLYIFSFPINFSNQVLTGCDTRGKESTSDLLYKKNLKKHF